jgi:hypothetical protein
MKEDLTLSQEKSFMHNFTLLILYTGIGVVLIALVTIFCCFLHPKSTQHIVYDSPIEHMGLNFGGHHISLMKKVNHNHTVYTAQIESSLPELSKARIYMSLSSINNNISANSIYASYSYHNVIQYPDKSEDKCDLECKDYKFEDICICSYTHYIKEVCAYIKQVSNTFMAFEEGCYQYNNKGDEHTSYIMLSEDAGPISITLIERVPEINKAEYSLDKMFIKLSRVAYVVLFIGGLLFMGGDILLCYVLFGTEKDDKFSQMNEETPDKSINMGEYNSNTRLTK